MTTIQIDDATISGTELAAIEDVVRRLQQHHAGTDPDDVDDVVRGHHDHFADARIRTYVPVLVERAARTALGR